MYEIERAPKPGWYQQGSAMRWWDGTQWTQHWQPMPTTAAGAGVAARAAQSPEPTVTYEKGVSGVEHMLHALLTLMTCGLWLPVWIIRGALGGQKRQVKGW